MIDPSRKLLYDFIGVERPVRKKGRRAINPIPESAVYNANLRALSESLQLHV